MATFTFVTHKGPRPEHRALVKSHVMRESQKKRKEAKKQQQQWKLKLDNPSKSSYLGCQQQLSNATALNTNDGISMPSDVGSYRFTNDSFSFDGLDVQAASRFEDLTIDGVDFDAPEQNRKGTQHFASKTMPLHSQRYQQQWLGEYLDSIYAHFDKLDRAFKSHALDFEHSGAFLDPDIWTQQLHAPYGRYTLDPSWILDNVSERLSEGYSHYVSSFYMTHPELAIEDPSKFWESRHAVPNSKVLIGCVMLFCMYRATIESTIDDGSDYFTSHVLSLINRCLTRSESGLSGDEMAVIFSVCMYENVRGNASAATHLRGIYQLLKARIGSRIRCEPSLDSLSCLHDLVYAVCSNVSPVDFRVTAPTLRVVQMSICSSEYGYPQSPLRLLNSGQFPETGALSDNSYIDVVRDAFDMFEMLCIGTYDADTALCEAYHFQARQEQAWGRLQIGMDSKDYEISCSTEDRTEEAIYLAAVIHFRAVTCRMQHNDSANVEDMMRLCAVLRAIEHGSWKERDHVYLWILLTGGAASVHQPAYRSFFTSELLRFTSCRLFEAESLKGTMANFVWLQQYLRGEMVV